MGETMARGCFSCCLGSSVFLAFLLTLTGFMAVLPCVIVSLILVVLTVLVVPRDQTRAVKALQKLDDPRAVGPLLAIFPQVGGSNRRALILTLTRLLPRVAPGDITLEDRQWTGLSCLLQYDINRHPDLLVAALQALERIGDPGALSLVEPLAFGLTKTAQETRVRRAAKACKARLEEIRENMRLSQTLLRPASAPEPPEETLLRPAQGASSTDSRYLLRPEVGDEARGCSGDQFE
jgi:HEAT repeat protein